MIPDDNDLPDSQVLRFSVSNFRIPAVFLVVSGAIRGQITQNAAMAMSVLCIAGNFETKVRLQKGAVMREKKEKWFELCEQAANEQDPEKLMVLIEQINALLQKKDERLTGKR